VYLERLLQINIATMAALGTLLLGMGQREPWLPLMMLIAAIASVWLTDVTGWIRLRRGVVNLLAVGVFFVFLWQASGLRGIDQIPTIGKFLVCLQMVFLFQKKEPRIYAWLALLSLVQVVVAAVFHQTATFGLLLTVYLFVGLSGLMLLFLHRERTRHRPARKRTPAPDATGGRWPLADQKPAFSDSTGGAAGQGGITRELRVRVVRMGLGTLAFALMLFLLFPRWGLNPWPGARTATRRSVGFSGEVTLGELGRIIENPQPVLQVQLLDRPGGDRYLVLGSLYLHGTVLTHYQKGQWGYSELLKDDEARPLPQTEPVPAQGLVWQKITIEPMDHETLFCVRPLVNTQEEQEEGDSRLRVNRARQLLLRPTKQTRRRFEYELATTAFVNRAQAVLLPLADDEAVNTRRLSAPPPTDGPHGMPGLVALADQWMEDSQLAPDDRFARARLLERQLRDSGRFQYSLQGQPRDSSVDPVEDFISNNPRGHCEYFATALVLMLRSQGIPARMVLGYKTDEWNGLGQFFQVRQLHAHTWVEAYLQRRHFPDGREGDDRRLEGASGAWLRLDPTPAGSAVRVHPLVEMIGKPFDWLDFLWANYVMDMDRSRQYETVYDPLADWIRNVVHNLRDPKWWRATWANLSEAMGTGLRNLIVTLAVLLLLFVLLVAYQVVRIVLRRTLRRARRAYRSAGYARTMVQFYHQLEALLARLGLTRLPAQTQREFAREAAARIAASPGGRDLAEIPAQIVEAFYRVRFGGVPLDKPQSEAVELALKRLKQTVGSKQ
jgi:transglutaminase-like putative cysteine protease